MIKLPAGDTKYIVPNPLAVLENQKRLRARGRILVPPWTVFQIDKPSGRLVTAPIYSFQSMKLVPKDAATHGYPPFANADIRKWMTHWLETDGVLLVHETQEETDV